MVTDFFGIFDFIEVIFRWIKPKKKISIEEASSKFCDKYHQHLHIYLYTRNDINNWECLGCKRKWSY